MKIGQRRILMISFFIYRIDTSKYLSCDGINRHETMNILYVYIYIYLNMIYIFSMNGFC